VDDERELVRRCLAGDAEAVRELIERFEHCVFGLCFRMLRHRHDAEDVAQISLLRAVRHLGGWDGSRPLQPWILTIAANRCRTHLERRRRLPRPAEQAFDVEATPVPKVEGLADVVDELLGTLREEYRTCFVLHHQSELGLAEIGEILGCPEGTVKTWLFRARKELAEKLRERGWDPLQPDAALPRHPAAPPDRRTESE
jgi:RNA polymerase sigma-70 factor, ECF subfamily